MSSSSPATTSAAQLRLMTDLKSMRTEPPEGCSASPISDDSIFVWQASIMGPPDTPFEGGIYQLRMTFPGSYPASPPRVRFTTEIFHPNVYADGSVCLDTLQDQWSPCQTVSSLLTSIQSLLTDPNPSSPANPEAAKLFVEDKKEYNKRIRRLAQKSAEML